MKHILNHLKPYKKGLLVALGLAVLDSVFALLGPQIFRVLTDRYATNAGLYSQEEFISGITTWLLLAIGASLLDRVAMVLKDFQVSRVTERATADIYEQGVAHSLRLPFGDLEDEQSGSLLEALRKAREDISAFVRSAINSLFIPIVSTIFVLTYSLFVHWSIALIFLFLIPAISLVTYFLSKKIREKQRTIVKKLTELSGSTTETIRNVELVKGLGLENQEIERLNQENEEIVQLEVQKIKLMRKLTFVQGTVIQISRTGLEFLLLVLVFFNLITLGEFFTMFLYSFYIFNPLFQLGTVMNKYQESTASAEKLNDILSRPAEKIPDNPVALEKITPITLESLHFGYNRNNSPALIDININIPTGNTVAFVGPSGSGKTTLIKMILALYKPTSGSIKASGHGLETIDPRTLRRRVGYVAQSTQLFSGTLRDNIRFVKPKATDEECLSVLRAAQAESILNRSESGLDTIIGEGGIKLSGGERQRLSIARALLRKPELLIFDEATSSLDSQTEQAITKTIQDIKEENSDITTILIAHRLSTVVQADTIFVLEHGKIAEQGSHQDLLEKNGLYKALWRTQIAS